MSYIRNPKAAPRTAAFNALVAPSSLTTILHPNLTVNRILYLHQHKHARPRDTHTLSLTHSHTHTHTHTPSLSHIHTHIHTHTLEMCVVNMITWHKCMHFCVRHEMCSTALAKDPPAFCSAAHAPVVTDIAAEDGVCPDETKHPPMPGERRMNVWRERLGVTRTSGPGNAWYREQRQGQT